MKKTQIIVFLLAAALIGPLLASNAGAYVSEEHFYKNSGGAAPERQEYVWAGDPGMCIMINSTGGGSPTSEVWITDTKHCLPQIIAEQFIKAREEKGCNNKELLIDAYGGGPLYTNFLHLNNDCLCYTETIIDDGNKKVERSYAKADTCKSFFDNQEYTLLQKVINTVLAEYPESK
ncbi:hypothetical protein ACFL6Y_10565 [Elusimicrobiota bacterium]